MSFTATLDRAVRKFCADRQAKGASGCIVSAESSDRGAGGGSEVLGGTGHEVTLIELVIGRKRHC
jgi:hypothetical protein